MYLVALPIASSKTVAGPHHYEAGVHQKKCNVIYILDQELPLSWKHYTISL